MAPSWTPPEVKHLPAAIRTALRQQCGGDWSRVTVDGRGVITVHNRPRPDGLRRPERVAKPKTPKGPTPRVPTTQLRKLAVPPPKQLPTPIPMPAVTVPAIETPEPAVAELRPPPPSRPEPRRTLRPASEVLGRARAEAQEQAGRECPYILLPGVEQSSDWDGSELADKAWRLVARVREGLGDRCPLAFHDDVTALHGVDLEQVESVARRADRVEVDPSTGWNRYPILKFHRGDNMVVIGFREPTLPMILAAYFTGWAGQGDLRERRGGGGARKSGGLPNTPSKMLVALRRAGAAIEEPSPMDKVVQVKYKGQDLGKVPVDPKTSKKDVESAFQRTLRRIDGLNQRERAGKVV